MTRRCAGGKNPVVIRHSCIRHSFVIRASTFDIPPWPFDVFVPKGLLPLKAGKAVDSVVMTDQVKSVGFRDRSCEFVAKAPDKILDEALAKVRAILDSDDAVEERT